MKEFDLKTEYSEKVDEIRKKLVETSFYKYGSARNNFARGYVNALESHDLCIEKYKETKNTEYLLDAMNYLMFEYMYPQLQGAYYRSTNETESAGISGISEREMEKLKENDF